MLLVAASLAVVTAGCFGGSVFINTEDGASPSLPEGLPTATTTGPKGAGLAYTQLTPSGSIDVTTNGAVIDRKDVDGKIRVYADNVTIKRSRIRHASGFGVEVMDGARNVRVEWVEIRGTSSSAVANIGTEHYECFRCNLSGAADGAKATNDVLIEESYIHSLRKFEGSHNDGVQNSGGDPAQGPVIIRGNAIWGPYQTSTSAVLAATNTGPIDGMVVEENFLYGGSYSLYLVDKGTGNGNPTNSVVRNNTFAKYTTGVYAVTGRSDMSTTVQIAPTVTFTSNKFDDGTAVR
jgi:hypothetical protein